MLPPLFASLLALLLAGCGGPVDTTDEDGDGWTVAEGDCDDHDPWVHPDADEDCGNGTEDDCDGLLDCEDGDCAYDGACWERDCYDGLDNDGNGLVDCRDDDCWTTGACTAASRVYSGGSAHWRTAWAIHGGNRAGGSAHTIDGTVRVGDVASTAFSCTWHAGVVTFECETSYYYGFTWADAQRSAFVLSSHCPLPSSTTAFLPGLCPGEGGIAARGSSPYDRWVAWYQGDRTLLGSHEHTTSGLAYWGFSTWSMAPIESGDSFTTQLRL